MCSSCLLELSKYGNKCAFLHPEILAAIYDFDYHCCAFGELHAKFQIKFCFCSQCLIWLEDKHMVYVADFGRGDF